jgi:hypothetical protein
MFSSGRLPADDDDDDDPCTHSKCQQGSVRARSDVSSLWEGARPTDLYRFFFFW